MSTLKCGCTWTKRCNRHNPNKPSYQGKLSEAAQKDAQLRTSGALPSPYMYVLHITEPDKEN